MKKVIVVSVTAFAFLAICTTVLFTSCQKKNVVQEEIKNGSKKKRMELSAGYLSMLTGLSFNIDFGVKTNVYDGPIIIGSSCLGYGMCELTACAPGPSGAGIELGEIDVQQMKLYMRNIDADFSENNPLIIHPNTDVPNIIRDQAGLPHATFKQGTYPMLYSPEAPNGYFEFDIMP